MFLNIYTIEIVILGIKALNFEYLKHYIIPKLLVKSPFEAYAPEPNLFPDATSNCNLASMMLQLKEI